LRDKQRDVTEDNNARRCCQARDNGGHVPAHYVHGAESIVARVRHEQRVTGIIERNVERRRKSRLLAHAVGKSCRNIPCQSFDLATCNMDSTDRIIPSFGEEEKSAIMCQGQRRPIAQV
jgi:hypothetical protein